MGLIPCRPPLPCIEPTDQQDSNSNSKSLHSESSSSSLSTQLSLPSVPSLSTSTSSSSAVRHRCIATLHSHSTSISSLALSLDTLFSGDSEILAWNPIPYPSDSSASSTTVAKIGGAVKCLAVYEDLIFSGHQDRKIRVWRKTKKAESARSEKTESARHQYGAVATLPTFNDRIRRCFSAKNYVEVRRHKKSTWVHHNDAVSVLAVAFPLVYSASWDRSFKVWRISDFRCLESVAKAHNDAINALVVSIVDGYVYTGSADKTIKVWRRRENDSEKNKIVHCHVATLEKHKSAVNALAVSGDGRVLYSGACDRSIIVWEKSGFAGDGEEEEGDVVMTVVGALRGHKRSILCLAAVGEDMVCSGSADNTVRVWRRRTVGGLGKKEYWCVAVLEGHQKPVKCLAIDRKRDDNDDDDDDDDGGCDKYVVYSGGLDGEIRVWRIEVPTT